MATSGTEESGAIGIVIQMLMGGPVTESLGKLLDRIS